ncbi:MAG: hypothetical protein NWQ43_13435 [Dolichospermum sp.]|nr:hypothetical protein [Dolichospermum sp.]
MKLPFIILTFFLCESLHHKSANAKPQPVSNVIIENSQAANLITQPVTINSYWNHVLKLNAELPLSVSDSLGNDDGVMPKCKKINPLNYINNPESFFQSCQEENNSNRRLYEPVEYLKVPSLDSGIKIKLGDF